MEDELVKDAFDAPTAFRDITLDPSRQHEV